MRIWTVPAVILLFMSPETVAMAADSAKVLFDFRRSDAQDQWQAVNDGVMGGVSEGRFKITDDKTLLFSGKLSLENNGGFASVRTRPNTLNFQTGDTIVARIRGDGREYSFNLYTNARLTAFSYRAPLKTKKDEWIEVRLPLDQFTATSFGRVVRDAGPVKPQDINGLGVLLGDKVAGPFKLEIEWIKVAPKPKI